MSHDDQTVSYPERMTVKKRPRIRRRQLKEWRTGCLFLLPAVLFLIFTSLYPLSYALYLTLFRWDLKISPERFFIGLDNFAYAAGDSQFHSSIWVTLTFVVVTVTVEVILGMAIALLVTREISYGRVARSLLLIPMVMTPVVVGILWRILFNPDFGLVNYVLSLFGADPTKLLWLGDPDLALWAVMITDIWEWTPFVVLVFVAGLTSLPVDTFKAARIDGASSWQIFWKISLPLLKPVILVTVLLRFLDAFKVVDTVYVMTYGGPGNTTKLLSFFIYETGLKYFNIGYASTVSWIFIVLMFALTFYLIRERQRSEQF
ncbi:MAG: sugar ABC transporter permease [bacterium]|nr:sugar ABC transporter permease [bacterium]